MRHRRGTPSSKSKRRAPGLSPARGIVRGAQGFRVRLLDGLTRTNEMDDLGAHDADNTVRGTQPVSSHRGSANADVRLLGRDQDKSTWQQQAGGLGGGPGLPAGAIRKDLADPDCESTQGEREGLSSLIPSLHPTMPAACSCMRTTEAGRTIAAHSPPVRALVGMSLVDVRAARP